MDLFQKLILKIHSNDRNVQHELQQMMNVLTTAVSVAQFKPVAKKYLEEDPEGFFLEIIEGHVARSIEIFTDISQEQADQATDNYNQMMEFLDQGDALPFGMPNFKHPQEISQQAIEDHIETMMEAREIFHDFILNDGINMEKNNT